MRVMRRKNKPVKGSEAWWQDLVDRREPGMPDWQRESYAVILDAGGVEAEALEAQPKALVMWLAEYDLEVVGAAVKLLAAARHAGAARRPERPMASLWEASADRGRGIVPAALIDLLDALERDPEAPRPAPRRPAPTTVEADDVYYVDELVAWYRTRPGTEAGEAR